MPAFELLQLPGPYPNNGYEPTGIGFKARQAILSDRPERGQKRYGQYRTRLYSDAWGQAPFFIGAAECPVFGVQTVMPARRGEA